jgi:hypothetical protein
LVLAIIATTIFFGTKKFISWTSFALIVVAIFIGRDRMLNPQNIA